MENGGWGTLLEVTRGCERMGYNMHRSSHWRYSVRKGVLINFAKFTGKHLCQSLFFLFFVFPCEFCEISKNIFFTEENTCVGVNKFYQKKIPSEVFLWEYCETFKNTYYEEHLRTTASVDRKTVWWRSAILQRLEEVIDGYSGKLLFENRDLNIALNFSTL